MSTLRYTHAIVARVPQSLNGKFEIKVDEARRQHEGFVALLRDLGLDVIELPPDEELPESVFIEDTAVIVNGVVLITKPGNIQRRKEVRLSVLLTIISNVIHRNSVPTFGPFTPIGCQGSI